MSTECKRCGNCCKSVTFALKDVPVNDDKREIGKWASYHNVEVMKHQIMGTEYLAIKIPGDCKFLTKNNDIYECTIYEQRPEVCKRFICINAGKKC